MKIDRHCRWVRDRLPLLAGGELPPEEGRKAERHLIGCPGCRERRQASSRALSALRLLGEESPVTAGAPSLWPALARQIRRSRHAPARRSWWESPLPRPWALATLATGFGAAMAVSVAQPLPPDPGEEAPAPVVVARTPTVEPGPEAPTLLPPTMTSRRGALPEAPAHRLGLVSQNPVKPIEPPSSILLRFDYDLDHGTPMSPGNHDPQRTF